jgi:hypothetical protein
MQNANGYRRGLVSFVCVLSTKLLHDRRIEYRSGCFSRVSHEVNEH